MKVIALKNGDASLMVDNNQELPLYVTLDCGYFQMHGVSRLIKQVNLSDLHSTVDQLVERMLDPHVNVLNCEEYSPQEIYASQMLQAKIEGWKDYEKRRGPNFCYNFVICAMSNKEAEEIRLPLESEVSSYLPDILMQKTCRDAYGVDVPYLLLSLDAQFYCACG